MFTDDEQISEPVAGRGRGRGRGTPLLPQGMDIIYLITHIRIFITHIILC
jgi:hypothetical protein